jgi:hypothetical protein
VPAPPRVGGGGAGSTPGLSSLPVTPGLPQGQLPEAPVVPPPPKVIKN